MKMILKGAVIAAGLALAGSANAAIVYTVSVWTGAPNGTLSSTTADNAHTPTGLASAQFTYTGPIDWVDNAPQNSTSSGNLFSNFFNAEASGISGFSSPRGTYGTEANFLAASMSAAGDPYASYFQITGAYDSGSALTGTITHDDGASVYIDGGNVYSSAPETSAVTGHFAEPGGSHAFTVDYVEGNGSPSVLQFTTGVPEPATWALMIGGLGLVGFSLRRRRALALA